MTFLSLEQQHVANAYHDKKTITTKYIDRVTAYRLAVKLAVDNISQTDTVVFLSRLKEKREEIYNLLEEYNLRHLVFETFSFSPISDEDISRIRTLVNGSLDLDKITAYEITQNRIKMLNEQLKKSYNRLNDPIYGNSTIDDLIHLQNRYDASIPVIEFDLEDYSPEYYHKLKDEIKGFMVPEFDLFDALEDNILLNIADHTYEQADYTNILNEFLRDLRGLHKAFKAEKKSIEQDLLMKSEKSIYEVEEILAAAKVEILKKNISISTDSSGGFKLPFFGRSAADLPFASILEETVKQVSSKLNIESLAIIEHAGNYEDAKTFLDDLTGKLRNQSLKEKILNKAILARINKLNTENKRVQELDAELNAIIKSINESELFNASFENNAFSFVRQIDSLASIISSLNSVANILKAIPQYVHWSRALHSQPELSEILGNLKIFPQDQWMAIFEKSFIHNMVGGHFQDLPNTDEALQEMLSGHEKLNALRSHYIDYIYLHKRIEAVENLKKNKKDIFQRIFKKKLPCKITYAELFQAAPDFVKAIFPIQFALRNEKLPTYYKAIYNFNEGEGSVVNAINFTAFDEDDFNEVLPAHVLPLYLNDYDYEEPLANLPNLHKLRASKKLAKLLLSISQNVNMYQLKQANIISLLPAKDDLVISAILEENGAKKLDVHNLYNRLTESILETERKQFLLTKNGLIDDRKQILSWQMYVLKLFKDSGFHIHSLWSAEFLNNPAHYESYIDEILGNDAQPDLPPKEVLEEVNE